MLSSLLDWQLLLVLWAGHYLADLALQSPDMAKMKRLVFVKPIGVHALTGHAFIHGLVAALLAQNFNVGAFIAVTHWIIDFGKSSLLFRRFLHRVGYHDEVKKFGLYKINVDQLLHFAMFVIAVYVILP